MQMLNATPGAITSNARIKHYPDCPVLQVSNAPIFRQAGYEPQERLYSVSAKGEAVHPERSLESSRNRARAAIRDIALCNEFTHFFTLTLNKEKIDRYDAEAIAKRLRNYLRNVSVRKGFRYLLVPEHHKDGALHFHGLCRIGDMQLVRGVEKEKGRLLSTKEGREVYNCPDWSLGFSTFIPLDENREKVAAYVCKYISKGESKIFGKWYWASRDLVKHPEKELIEGGVNYDAFLADNPDLPQIPLYRDVCMVIRKLNDERRSADDSGRMDPPIPESLQAAHDQAEILRGS